MKKRVFSLFIAAFMFVFVGIITVSATEISESDNLEGSFDYSMDFFINNDLIPANAFSETGEFQAFFDEEKGLYLVDITIEYGLNDSCTVSKLYSSDSSDLLNSSANFINTFANPEPGSKTTSQTKQYIIGGTLYFTYWVEGTFTWDLETCKVTDAKKGYTDYTSESTTVTSTLDKGSDQGSNFGFGNKYAYAAHNITLKNFIFGEVNLRAWLDVNRYGAENRN